MTLWQAVTLAVIQGVTEFLPVSSSGHLVIFQKIFGLSEPPVFFDIALHLGTLFSIMVYFKQDIAELIKNWQENRKVWLALVIGSAPVAVLGFLLQSRIDTIFDSMQFVGFSMVIYAAILYSTKFAFRKKTVAEELKEVSWQNSIIVGLFQAVAVLPGVSRSGSTITAGLWQKMSPNTAFRFSFLLSIPAILGAVFLKMKDAHFTGVGIGTSFIALVASAVVGYLSLRVLARVLYSEKFYYFAFYTLFIGTVILAFASRLP